MRGLILNCTLKRSPEASATAAVAEQVAQALEDKGVQTQTVRIADRTIEPGVVSDPITDADEWPAIHDQILDADILVIATPTWLGQPSSVSKRVLERMDAMISEKDDEDRPVAYNRVAGVVVTGNEDGAHHVINEVAGALIDIGYTIPGQAWTYWNKGPGPGDSYIEADDPEGKEWTKTTGEAAASNLVAVARALEARPMGGQSAETE